MLDSLFETLLNLYRKRKNLTVAELCERLGITMNYYYQFRSSKYQYLKPERIQHIAKALKLTDEEAGVLWTSAQLANKKFEIGDVKPTLSNLGMLYSIYEVIKYLETVDECSSSLILGSKLAKSPTDAPGWYVLDYQGEKLITYVQEQCNGPFLITYVNLYPEENTPVTETMEYPYWIYDNNDEAVWYPLSFANIIMSPDLSDVAEAIELKD